MFILLGLGLLVCAQGQENPTKFRIYDHLLTPGEHPDYNRRHVRPPTWETFGNYTRFTSLRGFPEKDGIIVDYQQEIDKYTIVHGLGDVLWPAYPIIFASNLGEVADEIKKRGLYLFDVWGYVPGSGPGGYWQQFKPPDGVFEMLESKLGERWLGMDVGEQDGRYIGGYAQQMYPSSSDRFQQYLNFQRHFQRMCDDLGNKMCTLVSLNFGHYFLKEGVYSLIGAETAQGLPNGQVYYSFIRGAGKQYGVPWFGNVSVYNRWGYKSYGSEGEDHGSTKGTSLSLMKRLMVSHILYNNVFVGFESGWFVGNELSPIGKLQQGMVKWVKEYGQPGIMHTPIAIMVDFFSGWSFPRHLYSSDVYRVWGNLPYGQGDYLTDGILDMFYPGYQDSSYFHDESGFIAPTPYGDIADCILSDAEEWLLSRYPVLIIAGELSGGLEIQDKLQAYVKNGGILVITAGNLAKLPGGIADITADTEIFCYEPGEEIEFENSKVIEEFPFEIAQLKTPNNARIIAKCDSLTAVAEVSYGKGRVVVFSSPYGISRESVIKTPVRSENDKHLPKPYPVLKHVGVVLDNIFKSQMLFDVGEGLSWIICRKNPGEFTLGICNNYLWEIPFKIISNCGPIIGIKELPFDQSEKQAIGYLPGGFEKANIGISADNTIAGGDVRVFQVRLKEQNLEEIPHNTPPGRPKGRILPLHNINSIKEEILARPTFFEYFDGVLIDSQYLHKRRKNALKQEAGWLQRQGLRIYVDLTSSINLFPDLRLLNNIQEDYSASIEIVKDIIEKMSLLNSRDLILSLHRFPENNFTPEESWKSFQETLSNICQDTEKQGISVYLRMCQAKPPWNLQDAIQFINRVGAKNLYLAPNIGLLLAQNVRPADIAGWIDRLGLWLASTPAFDIGGHLWSVHNPLIKGKWQSEIKKFLSLAPNIPVVFDVPYKNWDEVYSDLMRFRD